MTGVNKIRIVVSFVLQLDNRNSEFDFFISVLPAFNQDLKPALVSFMKALRIIVCTSNIISLFQLNHIRAYKLILILQLCAFIHLAFLESKPQMVKWFSLNNLFKLYSLKRHILLN